MLKKSATLAAVCLALCGSAWAGSYCQEDVRKLATSLSISKKTGTVYVLDTYSLACPVVIAQGLDNCVFTHWIEAVYNLPSPPAESKNVYVRKTVSLHNSHVLTCRGVATDKKEKLDVGTLCVWSQGQKVEIVDTLYAGQVDIFAKPGATLATKYRRSTVVFDCMKATAPATTGGTGD